MTVNKYIAYAIISVCLLLAAFLTYKYLSGDSVGWVRFMINFLLPYRYKYKRFNPGMLLVPAYVR